MGVPFEPTWSARGEILPVSAVPTGTYKKDAEGYSLVPLCSFNIINRMGDFYPADKAIPQLDGTVMSTFWRYYSDHSLYAEVRHPMLTEFSLPGVNERIAVARWLARLKQIDGTMTCAHIKKVEYETAGDGDWKNPKNEVRVWGWLKPTGPYARVVEDSFNTPSMNTYFSLRSICAPKMVGGLRHMHMHDICTFDYVTYGGMESACKHRAGLNGFGVSNDSIWLDFKIEHLEKLKDMASQEVGLNSSNDMGVVDRLLDDMKGRRQSSHEQLKSRFILPNSHRVLK